MDMAVQSAVPKKDEPKQENPLKDSVAIGVALLAVTAFGAFTIFLLSRLEMVEPQWTRAIYLLNGIEAIVFAATGYLFGKEVHRGQAKAAEARANKAEAKAEKETTDAVKGRALASAILAKESPSRQRDVLGADLNSKAQVGGEVEEVVRIARRLFPDA